MIKRTRSKSRSSNNTSYFSMGNNSNGNGSSNGNGDGSSNGNGSSNKACKPLSKKSFLRKEGKFTVNSIGNYIPNCDCFPNNLESEELCLPNCYFPYSSTDSGFTTIPEIIESFFKGKKSKSNQPTLIVGYGPPASGKGSIIKVLSRLRPDLNIREKNTVNGGLVDKIIQDTKQWKTTKAKLEKLCRTEEEKESNFQKLYSTYRHFADQISDQILYKAAAERWNIYWETTGWSNGYVIDVSKMLKKMGYRTICVYPYVFEKDILKRARQRAIDEGQTPKPDEGIKTVIGKSLENVLKLKEYMDEIIFVNNNNRKGEESIIFTVKNTKKGYKTKCNQCNKKVRNSLRSKRANNSGKKLYNRPDLLIKQIEKCCK